MAAVMVAGLSLLLSGLACASGTPPATPTPAPSVFEAGETVYGFFPTPPDVTIESVINTLKVMGQHGDVALIQRAIPWKDFINASDGPSQDITDAQNLVTLASRDGLEPIFVVDPLNGLDRRQFMGLPPELEDADFGTPEVRQAFQNYAVRLAREFHPRYLGLASEINTYADAHPDDFSHFVDIYHQTYAAIKAESPDTQVFVTFQWEDLNNLGPFNEGRQAYHPNWDQVEVFEPDLDVWAISSYPFAALTSADDIPADYYEPLLERTNQPLAVAEGGWGSTDIAPFHGTPEDQIGYLHAIDAQLGGHLAFWIYLIIQDFNLEAYRPLLEAQGIGSSTDTLGLFRSVGLLTYDGQPKPGLAVWDAIRAASH